MVWIRVMVFLLAATPWLSAQGGSLPSANMPLPIPPIIEGSNIQLNIREGQLDLPFGTSKTLGYNGNYLGPTIRVRRNDRVKIRIDNTLDEATTVHWHGLHVPAEFDGGPHQVIAPKSVWNPEFTIDQNAASLWYHPHLMGKTAEHVYRGLAGLFIIDDAYSDSLSIPKVYGVNDIPLILQDRDLDRYGRFSYRPSPPDQMHGYIGNAILVNGAYKPVIDLDRGTYRFRLLNGSNSSLYRISFSNRQNFTVIASDGGYLPQSVESSSLILSPGERYEILADFVKEEPVRLNLEIYGSAAHEAMTFNIDRAEGSFFSHPRTFDYSPVNVDQPQIKEREFLMETRGMGRFTINGRQMDLSTINFSLKKNTTEIWTIRNRGMGMMNIPHSFHVHDVQFTVLSYNRRAPHPLYSGPKDTILLMPGDEAVIAMNFRDYTGIYMYHCHLLEHEDSGMMGQFLIE